MNDTIALYKAERRFASTSSASARERALAVWLHRRRPDSAQGTLSPIYGEGLSVIPGWDRPSTRKADDEARWHERLAEVIAYRSAGNDWPVTSKPTPNRNGSWASGSIANASGAAAANWTRARKHY